MLRPRSPLPVKHVVALQSTDPDLARRARQLLVRRFGPIDQEAPWVRGAGVSGGNGLPTDAALLFSFEHPIPPGRLVEVVHESIGVEAQIADACLLPETAEPVLIQPGYVDPAKFVLGATRDGPNRVFLSNAIYAELTLQYAGTAWRPLPWTASEWLGDLTLAFLSAVRARLMEQREARVIDPDVQSSST